MKDTISIIMPTFNSGDTLVQSIESILSQSYPDWELLITDDCSTDNTFDIIESYQEKDSRIKGFKNNFNSGAAVTRNNSIGKASGEFIAFLDSDDLWLPDKLEKQIAFMKNNKISFSFTAFSTIDSSGHSLGKTVDLQGENISFSYQDMLKKKATLGCSTVMFKKESFDDFFMPLIRTGQDYALWLKLLKGGSRAYLINEVLTFYRILPNSISRNKLKKCKRQWQIYRDIEKLSLHKAIECFTFYAWRAIFRK